MSNVIQYVDRRKGLQRVRSRRTTDSDHLTVLVRRETRLLAVHRCKSPIPCNDLLVQERIQHHKEHYRTNLQVHAFAGSAHCSSTKRRLLTCSPVIPWQLSLVRIDRHCFQSGHFTCACKEFWRQQSDQFAQRKGELPSCRIVGVARRHHVFACTQQNSASFK